MTVIPEHLIRHALIKGGSYRWNVDQSMQQVHAATGARSLAADARTIDAMRSAAEGFYDQTLTMRDGDEHHDWLDRKLQSEIQPPTDGDWENRLNRMHELLIIYAGAQAVRTLDMSCYAYAVMRREWAQSTLAETDALERDIERAKKALSDTGWADL
jgi:hypothetical protein